MILLPLLLLLLLSSCRTLPTVQVVPRIQHDTTYVTTHHYDSIYVENQLIQERRSDTLYVDRLSHLYTLASIPGLLILLLCLIKGFRR